MALRTRLTDVLGIEHPVMLAGMGGVSYSELVAAVSDAGGFGCLGASTMQFDQMVEFTQRLVRLSVHLPRIDRFVASHPPRWFSASRHCR